MARLAVTVPVLFLLVYAPCSRCGALERPDVEFRMDLEVAGITPESRDYDVQQHKPEVYREFEQRLRTAFPEGFRIDRFEFGLGLDTDH